MIHARIEYGGHDVTVPIPVRIEWAGDTPVISLTDVEVPGLGTFTARVLFYRGRYAGTWQHGETGGSQFGRILPAQQDKPLTGARPSAARGPIRRGTHQAGTSRIVVSSSSIFISRRSARSQPGSSWRNFHTEGFRPAGGLGSPR